MNKDYLHYIATRKDLSVGQYKILLLLASTKELCQKDIYEQIGSTKQWTSTNIITLEKRGLISMTKQIGTTKFYTSITDVHKLNTVLKGQLTINDMVGGSK